MYTNKKIKLMDLSSWLLLKDIVDNTRNSLSTGQAIEAQLD